MSYKSLEIYYDVASIPGIERAPDMTIAAVHFRNAARDLIEKALGASGLGEWAGTAIGPGEVTFGFEVVDFDRAERLIRSTVAGTAFAGIRDILRFDEDPYWA